MPGFVGFPELLLLGLVVLVLFGPKRLPEMGRGLGKGLREFKNSVTGDHEETHVVEVPNHLTAAPTAVDKVAPRVVSTEVAVDPIDDEPVVISRRDVA